MADDLIYEEGSGTKKFHTKERTSNIHNEVVELNIGGASEALLTLPAAAALADGASNPTTHLVGAGVLVWNGSTWDRLPGNTSGLKIQGAAAADAAVAGNPLYMGGRGSAATPTAASADGDAVGVWTDLYGRVRTMVDNTSIAGTAGSPNAGVLSVQGITSMTPVQIGLGVANTIQWSHYSNEYTTAQTGTALVNGASGQKFYIGRLTLGTAGTTAGLVTVWFGQSADTTYTAGTDKTVFRGTLTPTSSSTPGVVIGSGVAPFIISNAYDYLRITTSAAITVYVQVDYILV